MRSDPGAQPNQSLIDGILTLQALATSPEPIGCRELARRLGFDASKVNRMLKTLAHLGIARQTANRRYTAGPGMHVLAAQSLFATGIIRRALPALEHLRRFGHTVALGVLWQDSVSYLFHAPPGIDSSSAIGRIGLLPAPTSGIGMALLAQLTDSDVAALYEGRDVPGEPGGISALLARIAEVRAAGYARVNIPDDRGFHSVAVPVGHPVYAAVAVSGWIPDGSTAELVAALNAAAEQIESLPSSG